MRPKDTMTRTGDKMYIPCKMMGVFVGWKVFHKKYSHKFETYDEYEFDKKKAKRGQTMEFENGRRV